MGISGADGISEQAKSEGKFKRCELFGLRGNWITHYVVTVVAVDNSGHWGSKGERAKEFGQIYVFTGDDLLSDVERDRRGFWRWYDGGRNGCCEREGGGRT